MGYSDALSVSAGNRRACVRAVEQAFQPQLGVALLEIAVQRAESRNLRRTHESEVLGPEEINFPLVRVVALRNGLEGLAILQAHRRDHRKIGQRLAGA